MSPTTKTSGCPGRVRSGSTAMRPARSSSRSALPWPARRPAARPATPAAQIAVWASSRWPMPSASVMSTPGSVHPDDPGAHAAAPRRDARSVRGRLCGELIAEGGEGLFAPVEKDDADRARVDASGTRPAGCAPRAPAT